MGRKGNVSLAIIFLMNHFEPFLAQLLVLLHIHSPCFYYSISLHYIEALLILWPSCTSTKRKECMVWLTLYMYILVKLQHKIRAVSVLLTV